MEAGYDFYSNFEVNYASNNQLDNKTKMFFILFLILIGDKI